MSNGLVGSYTNLPIITAQRAEDPAATAPTSEQEQLAAQFPPGLVEVERSGLQMGLRIPGGLAAAGGATILAISLLSGRSPGASASRLLAAPLVVGGSLVGLGAASVIGAELLPSKKVVAVATNIPTRVKAQQIANTMTDRQTKVVEDLKGTFAVLDEGPIRSGGSVSNGYERGRGHYYGDGHYHGDHYYGDGHYHEPGYYEPYYPGSGDYYPIPYERPTSYGDDGGGYSGGNSGGDTSWGDDGGSSYNPPPSNYNPPSSYDPPSYDPPSYDPPSSSYGNSSSNGNPSDDDF